MQKGRRLRKIARLDIKSEKLLKPIRAEGLRNLGLAKDFSKRYYEKGIDEIIVVDIVASLYRRDPIWSVLRSISNHCYIPITYCCLLYTSPSPRDLSTSRMPSSA